MSHIDLLNTVLLQEPRANDTGPAVGARRERQDRQGDGDDGNEGYRRPFLAPGMEAAPGAVEVAERSVLPGPVHGRSVGVRAGKR